MDKMPSIADTETNKSAKQRQGRWCEQSWHYVVETIQSTYMRFTAVDIVSPVIVALPACCSECVDDKHDQEQLNKST